MTEFQVQLYLVLGTEFILLIKKCVCDNKYKSTNAK